MDSDSHVDAELLHMSAIHKSFGGVRALRGVDFTLRAGEVHALLGQNGAGKSTLMKVLAGVHRADSGQVIIDGTVHEFNSPAAANAAGVAMIHQELDLVASQTVSENLFLGAELTRAPGIVNRKAMDEQSRKFLADLGIKIDPLRLVGSLRVGEQQMVAIARVLRQNARIIVMDEPTSALSDSEVSTLFALIPQLKSRGIGVVFISHRMDEIERICDRGTVIRDGEVAGVFAVGQTSPNEIIRMMLGRRLDTVFPDRRALADDAPTRLEVRNLTVVPGRDTSRREPHDINFSVREGEIVGLAGLLGAGRTEVLEAIFGLARKRMRGEILLDGKRVKVTSPRSAGRLGLGFVPEDRRAAGLVMPLSVGDNLVLSMVERLSRFGWRSTTSESASIDMSIQQLRIKTKSPETLVPTLSGGNQQKVVFGRNLATKPRVLLLDDPTRGVDIGAKGEIYELLDQLASEGLAVVMASSEISELVGLCDRIMVLRNGQIVATFDGADADEENVLAAAAHISGDQEKAS